MKLILFVIIILIIYLIGTQIKVVHADTLPAKERTDIENRTKIREMLLHNHIKSHAKATVEKFSNIPKAKKLTLAQLINKIRREYLDPSYRFNIVGLPVTTRCMSPNSHLLDRKYIKHIKLDINGWARANNIKIKHINPIFIQETENEFIITINVELFTINVELSEHPDSIFYPNSIFYLELTYYGQIERTDDFINGGSDVYKLQLVDLKRISQSTYQSIIQAADDYCPFPSMQSQMSYVDKINKLHQSEIN